MKSRTTALFFVWVILTFGVFFYFINQFLVFKESAGNYLVMISSQMNSIEEKNKEITHLSGEVENLQEKIEEYGDLNIAYESLRSSKGLINPQLQELVSFVNQDKTNENEYIKGEFDCTNFVNEFINNFAEQGFFSCLTYVLFDKGAHAIVATNTTDFGVVFVETQDDKIIYTLELEEDYCKKMGWKDCDFVVERIVNCFG